MDKAQPTNTASGEFLRLWVILVFSYTGAKLLFDQVVMGYFDARPRSLAGLLLIPTMQALVFWIVSRRQRQARSDDTRSA